MAQTALVGVPLDREFVPVLVQREVPPGEVAQTLQEAAGMLGHEEYRMLLDRVSQENPVFRGEYQALYLPKEGRPQEVVVLERSPKGLVVAPSEGWPYVAREVTEAGQSSLVVFPEGVRGERGAVAVVQDPTTASAYVIEEGGASEAVLLARDEYDRMRIAEVMRKALEALREAEAAMERKNPSLSPEEIRKGVEEAALSTEEALRRVSFTVRGPDGTPLGSVALTEGPRGTTVEASSLEGLPGESTGTAHLSSYQGRYVEEAVRSPVADDRVLAGHLPPATAQEVEEDIRRTERWTERGGLVPPKREEEPEV